MEKPLYIKANETEQSEFEPWLMHHSLFNKDMDLRDEEEKPKKPRLHPLS